MQPKVQPREFVIYLLFSAAERCFRPSVMQLARVAHTLSGYAASVGAESFFSKVDRVTAMTRNEVITILVVVAIIVLLVMVWLNDRRMRRKSSTPLSGMVASFDQVFHPEAAKATEIREIQRELPAEASVPGDPL